MNVNHMREFIPNGSEGSQDPSLHSGSIRTISCMIATDVLIEIAARQKYITNTIFKQMIEKLDHIDRMIMNLIKKIS